MRTVWSEAHHVLVGRSPCPANQIDIHVPLEALLCRLPAVTDSMSRDEKLNHLIFRHRMAARSTIFGSG
jgi:hypothetical protein